MELRGMKIGRRLSARFGIVLLLMVAPGVVSYLQIGNMHDHRDVMKTSADLKDTMKDVGQQENNYMLREDGASIDILAQNRDI
jgi:CHASE3 domain sensor protein